MMLLIAFAVMVAATIAVHMGLPQSVCGLISKVCRCNKCLSFWATFAVLLLAGCNIAIAAMLSLLMGYTSNWLGLLLVWLNDKYQWLWERVNRNK